MTLFLAVGFAAKAQTVLNESGNYEHKVVEQYEGVNASDLFDRTLVALSDMIGSSKHSKFNFDVKEKDGGIIVYKGLLFVGFRKVNISGGYNYFADCTLKVRMKDGKAQYIVTVPSMTLTWDKNSQITEQVPLKSIIPEYNYKARLYYIKKGCIQYAPEIATRVKSFVEDLVAKTKNITTEDDF